MTTRITGLTSGLDVDALVKAGASAQQSKVDKAKQQEQIYEWKQEQYRDIQTSVSDFYNKYLDVTSSTSLTSSSIWNTKTFSSSDSSVVTAEATSSDADITNYTVSVSQLATAATYTIDNATLSKLLSNKGSESNYTIGNTTITLDANSFTDQATLAKALNDNLNFSASYTAKYSAFANSGKGGVVITSNTLGFTNDKLTIKTGSESFEIGKDDKTGTNLEATITDKNGNKYEINDTTNKSANTITLDNVKFTFNNVTKTTSNDGNTSTDSPVKITGSNNVSNLAERISSFITDYNNLITTINGKLYETYDRNYQPLTDDQKESMTDSQIEKWETKAKTGLLKNDSYLEKLASDMKSAMSGLLGGINLSTIGIKAVSNYTTKNGTYTVDSDALKSALQNGITKNTSSGTVNITFNNIKTLFTGGVGDITSISTSVKDKNTAGILANLKVSLNINATMSSSSLAQRAGIVGTTSEYTNELTESLKNQATLIDKLKEKLEDKKDSLYSKYSSLETSLNSLNSSSSIFSSKS